MRALAVVLLIVACDSKATTSEPGGARAEQKSKEYESCGASMHCQDELRCFDHMCRRIARSTIGDYFAANGARLRTNGDLEGAISSYASALAHYDAAKLGLPPDIDCDYGATLAAARSRKEHAELAARVLHRCVLAVPVGSTMRDQALAQLANLTDNGLDPTLLGATKLADLYLTKGAAAPATDKLTVSVTANPTPKSWSKVTEKLEAPDVKPALIACWSAYNAASKKDEMTVSFPLKVSFYNDPDYPDEGGGGFSTKLDPPAGAVGPEDGCVRAAVEPAIKGLRLAESINSKVTITIK